jgi:uncharacterized peroxidase-related enzyme
VDDRTATEISSLSLAERQIACLVVSAINGSTHHIGIVSRQLLALGVPRWLVDAIVRAPAWPSSEDDRLDVITMFAAQLTAAPRSIAATGIDRLRSVGLTDRDIVELVNLIGYYNCVNRVAAGIALR